MQRLLNEMSKKIKDEPNKDINKSSLFNLHRQSSTAIIK